MEKVDKTIEAISEWIQKELGDTNNIQVMSILPDMTKALAELVTARAKCKNYFAVSSSICSKTVRKNLDTPSAVSEGSS